MAAQVARHNRVLRHAAATFVGTLWLLYGFRRLQPCTLCGTSKGERTEATTGTVLRVDAGKVPVRDWLLSLSQADRKAIGDDIRTAEFGWPLGMVLLHGFIKKSQKTPDKELEIAEMRMRGLP